MRIPLPVLASRPARCYSARSDFPEAPPLRHGPRRRRRRRRLRRRAAVRLARRRAWPSLRRHRHGPAGLRDHGPPLALGRRCHRPRPRPRRPHHAVRPLPRPGRHRRRHRALPAPPARAQSRHQGERRRSRRKAGRWQGARKTPSTRPKTRHSPAKAKDEEYEFTSGEADVDTYDGETVVLDGFVREAILLEVPNFPLCSEGCPGILSRGRASGPQKRRVARIDPRLAPLGALRDLVKKDGGPRRPLCRPRKKE